MNAGALVSIWGRPFLFFFFFRFCVTCKTTVRRSHASCLIRARRGLIFHPFLFLSIFPLYFILLTVMNNHLIHAQQDGLVDWPYKVILQKIQSVISSASSTQSRWRPLEKKDESASKT